MTQRQEKQIELAYTVAQHTSDEPCGICLNYAGFSEGVMAFVRIDTGQPVCEDCAPKHASPALLALEHLAKQGSNLHRTLTDQTIPLEGAILRDDMTFGSMLKEIQRSYVSTTDEMMTPECLEAVRISKMKSGEYKIDLVAAPEAMEQEAIHNLGGFLQAAFRFARFHRKQYDEGLAKDRFNDLH